MYYIVVSLVHSSAFSSSISTIADFFLYGLNVTSIYSSFSAPIILRNFVMKMILLLTPVVLIGIMAVISFNDISVSPVLLLGLFLLDLRKLVTDEDQIVVLLSLNGLEPTVLQSADADIDIRVLRLL